MRITGIRVDGYGMFSGLEIEELPAGLTVVVGANEAGKSTLLDFLRGVLFGFPDRRSKAAYHEPLRGGRHGGAIRLADSDGRRYVVERHLDSHGLEVSGPDGSPIDARRLSTLLGGADEALYRSVFAFGLGELAAFETLDRDEVRDLVFSAGVLGAGRSATRAARVLEQRRIAIVRPRRQDALANTLQRRLDDLDSRLRAARRTAESYPTLRATCERLEEQAAASREGAAALDKRARILDQITLCWPIFLERRNAAARLDALPPLADGDVALLGQRTEVRRLEAAASGHEERLARHGELRGQLATIDEKMAVIRAELGLEDHAPIVPADVATAAEAAALAEAHTGLMAARAALRDRLAEARSELAEASDTAEIAAGGGAVRDERELLELSLQVNELRRLLRDHDRHREEARSAEREERLAALASPARIGPALPAPLIWLVIVFALATMLSTLGSHRGPGTVSFTLGALCVGAAIAAAVIAARSKRRRPALASPSAVAEHAVALERALAASAARLGLEAIPTAAAVETCGELLELERADRRRIDEAERALEVATRHYAVAVERVASNSDEATAIADSVERLAEKLGLGPVGPRGLLDAIELLARGEGLAAARLRVVESLGVLSVELSEFHQGLLAVEERGLTPASGDTTPRPLLDDEDALARVSWLAERLVDVERRAQARAELEEAIVSADGFLAISLGSGPHGTALRDELEREDVLGWQEERERIEELAREATLCSEAARDELHEADRSLAELAGSDEIASLELEREAVAQELDDALSNWLALGLARTYLDRTLARYERERQPRVIALAAELFQEVTDGRYVALVAREANEGGRRHGIDAIGRSGERVPAGDLSRGTAEQLYLCLRLAFASTFAEQAASLPLILDDVLVNFDPARSAAMARVVARVAEGHQVFAFTCHPHIAERFSEASAGLRLVELSPVPGFVEA